MAAIGPAAVDGLLDILVDPGSTPMQTGLASWGLAFVGARAPEACARLPNHPMPRSARQPSLPSGIKSRTLAMRTRVNCSPTP